jgi:hypothetical protein
MLYGAVALRSADHPWGPWSPPIQVFDFGRDNGASFMQHATAYGPYIIARFTEFDRMSRELTIYYNMSTWDPYQVMLMRTVLRMDCSYDENFHCPTGGAVPEPPIPEGTEMPPPVPEGTGMPPPGIDASG